mgnify:CR=1 FL=1
MPRRRHAQAAIGTLSRGLPRQSAGTRLAERAWRAGRRLPCWVALQPIPLVIALDRCPVGALSRWRPAGVAALLGLGLLAAAPPAPAQLLYRLETRCSLAGGQPQPCVIEARNDGDSTIYEHTKIGRAHV